MRRLILSSLVVSVLGAGSALAAANRCDAPVTEWQPREALQQKLESEGWKVTRIKTEGGCYEVYAIDDKGKKVETYFNPKTFEPVPSKREQ